MQHVHCTYVINKNGYVSTIICTCMYYDKAHTCNYTSIMHYHYIRIKSDALTTQTIITNNMNIISLKGMNKIIIAIPG